MNKITSMNFNNQEKYYDQIDWIQVNINSISIHNLPKEITDEDENCSYNNSIIILNNEINNGIFKAKKLTEEEWKKQQEEKNNKNKKKKINNENEEDKNSIDINNLTEQELYNYYEDLYKNPQIKFEFNVKIEEEINNKITIYGSELAIFEEIGYKSKENCGIWVILKREKILNAEELQKLQKKNKNFINEPIYYKTFLNFDIFKTSNNQLFRSNLEEFINFTIKEDESEEDFEKRKNEYVYKSYNNFYIKIDISLNSLLMNESKDMQFKTDINKSTKGIPKPKSELYLLKKEYKSLIKVFFDKIKKQQILENILIDLRINLDDVNFYYKIEINKEKIINLFFEKFRESNDYIQFKETLVWISSKISKEMFNKTNDISGNINNNDKFYTDIHSYLLSKMMKYLNKIIEFENNMNNDVIIKDNKNLKAEKTDAIEKLLNKNVNDHKYELIKIYCKNKRYFEALNIINSIIEKDKENYINYKILFNINIWMNNLDDAEANLYKSIILSKNDHEINKKFDKINLFLISLKRKKNKESFGIIKTLLEKKPHSKKYNFFNFYYYKINNINDNLTNKYFEIFKRNLLRKLNKLPDIKEPFEPILKKKIIEVTPDEFDEYYIKLLKFLNNFKLKEVSFFILNKLFNDKNNHEYLYFDFKLNKNKYLNNLSIEDLNIKLDFFINNNINIEYFIYIKFKFNIKYNDHDLIEELFNKSIDINQNNKYLEKTLYLMSLYYKSINEYECSRILLFKLVNSNNNFSYWNEIGVICCILGQYNDSEEAFKKANILDHNNSEIWMNIIILLHKLNYKGKLIMAVKELSKLEIYNLILLIRVLNILKERILEEEFRYFKDILIKNHNKYKNYILNENFSLENLLDLIN